MMDERPIDRLIILVDYLGFNKSRFEAECGLSNGFVNNLSKRDGNIGGEALNRIYSVFPAVNVSWLVTGEGKMIKSVEDEDVTEYTMRDESMFPIIQKGDSVLFRKIGSTSVLLGKIYMIRTDEGDTVRYIAEETPSYYIALAENKGEKYGISQRIEKSLVRSVHRVIEVRRRLL